MSPFRAKTGQVCLQPSLTYWYFLSWFLPCYTPPLNVQHPLGLTSVLPQWDVGGKKTNANRKRVLPVVLRGITSFASDPVFL